ncbi:hypothetical protein LCGC14_3145050, partial [marine sediment metagenome]
AMTGSRTATHTLMRWSEYTNRQQSWCRKRGRAMARSELRPSPEEFCEALTEAWKRVDREACDLLAYMLCLSDSDQDVNDMKQDRPPNVSDERTTMKGERS